MLFLYSGWYCPHYFFCEIAKLYFHEKFFWNILGHCELLYDTVEDEENHVKVMHKAKRKARERKTPKVVNY